MRVIWKNSVGIRQHKRSSSSFCFYYLWKHHQCPAYLSEEFEWKYSSNCSYKWQVLGHYRFFIPLVMFPAVSSQQFACFFIILSVFFSGPYCGIHMETSRLHVKFWDQFQPIKSMLAWQSISFVSSFLVSFSDHSLGKHTVS